MYITFLRIVHLLAEIQHHGTQLFKRHRNLNVDLLCRAVETAQVIVKLQRHMVDGKHRVVHAVTKVAAALVHGDHHVLNRGDFPVVVCDILHIHLNLSQLVNAYMIPFCADFVNQMNEDCDLFA